MERSKMGAHEASSRAKDGRRKRSASLRSFFLDGTLERTPNLPHTQGLADIGGM